MSWLFYRDKVLLQLFGALIQWNHTSTYWALTVFPFSVSRLKFGEFVDFWVGVTILGVPHGILRRKQK